jgi:hypothetical protein
VPNVRGKTGTIGRDLPQAELFRLYSQPAKGELMRKPGQLQKPVRAGALHKDQPCPGCGMRLGNHTPQCTWAVAAAELQKPKAPGPPVTDEQLAAWRRSQGRS